MPDLRNLPVGLEGLVGESARKLVGVGGVMVVRGVPGLKGGVRGAVSACLRDNEATGLA